MTALTRNFIGIPIDGDITRGDRRVEQKPLSELEPLLRAVLNDPTIHSIGWYQYTPYFNDGEPCTFSVGEPWFRTVDDVRKAGGLDENDEGYAWLGKEQKDDEEDDDDYDYEDDDTFTIGYGGHPSLGERKYDYVGEYPNRERVDRGYEGPDEARFDRVQKLADAVNSGAFEDVFLEAFGDHCRVTITATGITVDEYSHD